MTKEQQTLLSLLKIALCHKTEDIPSNVDWLKVLDIAVEQGMTAIVFDAITLLKPEKCPDIDILMEWMGQSSYNETVYEQHKETIGELAKIFNSNGLKMMLLKGYGLSLNYPVPEHRPCGDIDIYLYGEQKIGDNLIKSIGIDVNDDNPHHSTFAFKDITVENHCTFLDQDNHKSNIRMEGLFNELLFLPQSRLNIVGQNLYAPSTTLNAIYLIRHAGEHFATEKISLRHVLDIGTFFQTHSDEVDWKFVLKVYQEENMMDFYSSIATICIRDLGFNAPCFKGFQIEEKLADRVLVDIFSNSEELPMSTAGIKGTVKVKYGIKKSLRWYHNRWKYKIVYDESMWQSFWTLALNRIKN